LQISKLDVEKNKLSGETSDAVVKQKQLTDERHSLEKQLGSAKQEAVVVDQQIAQADNQIAKESQDVRNAQNELDSIRRQRPKWHCIWRCRKKWKRAQRGRIEAAENVLAAARQRESNAVKAKNDAVSRRGTVRDRISRTEQALAQNKQKYEQLKATLLKRTNLTETILQLLKDLTSLQVNVIHLRQELQARQELDNDDLGVGWESINTPLNAISNYLNNGGFVKDLAGWGIDIKGSFAKCPVP
uniref:Chromosome segregation protein SMC n=1 Tax=Anisakis simplex TaxID=6269 RepID=A0A0M3KEN8_ANISI